MLTCLFNCDAAALVIVAAATGFGWAAGFGAGFAVVAFDYIAAAWLFYSNGLLAIRPIGFLAKGFDEVEFY